MQKMTKWEAVVQMMIVNAIKGDSRAVNGLLTIARNTGQLQPEEQARQGGVPPAARNQRVPIGCDTPHANAASQLDRPAAMRSQNASLTSR